MVEMLEKTDIGALLLALKNPLPYRQRLKALRVFHAWMGGCAMRAGQ